MAIFVDFGRLSAIFGNLWQCFPMFSNPQWFLAIFGGLRRSLAIFLIPEHFLKWIEIIGNGLKLLEVDWHYWKLIGITGNLLKLQQQKQLKLLKMEWNYWKWILIIENWYVDRGITIWDRHNQISWSCLKKYILMTRKFLFFFMGVLCWYC